MPVVALKLVLAPILIAIASLVARRWGPSVGGWLVALPLTSGPVLLFLALEHGLEFGTAAAIGALAGIAAIAAFALAYALGGRPGPFAGMAVATVVFCLVGIAVQPVLDDPTWVVLAIVVVAISVALRLMPAGGGGRMGAGPPRWDIPARMAVAVSIVFVLTAIAPALGPRLSGLIATFPVYVSVMSSFTQRSAGLPATVDLLRGVLLGLYGTAAFFAVLVVALVPAGVAAAFGGAVVAALGIQVVALRTVRASLVAAPA